MTKMIYIVICRPKGNNKGRTDIGWEDDGVSEEVPVAGYLTTSRTPKGSTKQYTATVIKETVDDDGVIHIDETVVGHAFETRAQAAFAIWRAYYHETKEAKRSARAMEDAVREQRRHDRVINRMVRNTETGQKEYRDKLNADARARYAGLSADEKAVLVEKRKAARRRAKDSGSALEDWGSG